MRLFEILHKVFAVGVLIATVIGVVEILDGVGGLGDNIDTLSAFVAGACFLEMLGLLMLSSYRHLQARG